MVSERQSWNSFIWFQTRLFYSTISEISLHHVQAETFWLPPITCTSGLQIEGALGVPWRLLSVHYGGKLGNRSWWLLGWPLAPTSLLLCLVYSWASVQDVWRKGSAAKTRLRATGYWMELKLWLLLLLLAVVPLFAFLPPSLLPPSFSSLPEHNYYIFSGFYYGKIYIT